MQKRRVFVALAIGLSIGTPLAATTLPMTPIAERVDSSEVIVVGRVFDVYGRPEADYGTLLVDSILVRDRTRWRGTPWGRGAVVALSGHGIGICDSSRALWFLTRVSGHTADLYGYWPLALDAVDMMPGAKDGLRKAIANHPSPARQRVLQFIERQMRVSPPSRWYFFRHERASQQGGRRALPSHTPR